MVLFHDFGVEGIYTIRIQGDPVFNGTAWPANIEPTITVSFDTNENGDSSGGALTNSTNGFKIKVVPY